jgi:Ca2+ transporting ATPase
LTPALRDRLADIQLDYGRRGLRTLGFAYVDQRDSNVAHFKTNSAAEYVKFESDMTFVGLVGMLDPPRPEVRAAIAKCRQAGIRTIVITGDNKNTAETICREIGVFGRDEDLTGKSYTGRQLEELSHAEKIRAVQTASLFSRTEPTHKSQLVDLLQSLGMVVAMVRVPRLSRD